MDSYAAFVLEPHIVRGLGRADHPYGGNNDGSCG